MFGHPSLVAEMAAIFKPRKPAAQIRQDETVWQEGFDAGMAMQTWSPHPRSAESFSWFSGYIEGQAKRQSLTRRGLT